MTSYYNEWEPYPAQWLRNLCDDGQIPIGHVDETDIRKVTPDALEQYTQCHFFSGVGGWPIALRIAGWPADRPVWSGSPPCQPFSSAGKRLGEADERHLWPNFRGLISERGPPTIFGEQVADVDGRKWFSGVRADLEALGYAVGGADLCAAGVNSPHIRQRIFWVAHREGERYERGEVGNKEGSKRAAGCCGEDEGMRLSESSNPYSTARRWWDRYYDARFEESDEQRRIGSDVLPLVNGLHERTSQVRAYGNAIVPQVAAIFVKAFMEITL